MVAEEMTWQKDPSKRQKCENRQDRKWQKVNSLRWEEEGGSWVDDKGEHEGRWYVEQQNSRRGESMSAWLVLDMILFSNAFGFADESKTRTAFVHPAEIVHHTKGNRLTADRSD